MATSKLTTPPRLARRLLLWFLRHDLAEEVQGDLDEKFYLDLETRSAFSARRRYWYQVIHYLRPFALRKSSSFYTNQFAMLENYFKIGWRNMTKQKMYSSIKVGGFALGIAACLLIALFIRHEMSYDKQYPKGDRIYRIVEVYNNKGTLQRGVHLPAPLGLVLKENFPEIVEVARINPVELFGAGSNDVRRDDQLENTREDGFVYADPTFLQMLDAPFVYGDAKTSLSEASTIVLTRSRAEKYFPGEDPRGKILILNNDATRPYKIGGVVEDFPVNSHIQYQFFITLTGREFGQGEQTNWLQSNYPTYVLVQPGTDPVELGTKLHLLGKKYYLPRMIAAQFPDAEAELKNLSYMLQPINNIYLNEPAVFDGLNHGDVRFIWLSGAIAIFILIIACINFINLSTAKSANRAKEVGLRKVVGSFRSNLIKQFLTESILFSILSFVLGIALAWTLSPLFASLVGKTILFPWNEWQWLPIMAASAIVIGIIAGVYPSFYLSSFRPIEVLKGNVARGSKSAGTRSALVVFQFTTSIVLIISTFVIYRQMQHILTAKVGFEKNQVIVIQGANLLGEQVSTFKEELLQIRDVKNATLSDYLPIRGTKRNGNGFWISGRRETDMPSSAQFWKVDHDYISTLGITVKQGRNFDIKQPTDNTDAIIINEAMAKELGLQDPVGKVIQNYKDWTIIGVIEDFHFESMKDKIRPLSMVLGNRASTISVKAGTADMPGLLDNISKTWKKFAPHQPIRYTFLDESFARMYEDVARMGRIFTSFSILAIVVACLGLFGLSSFMVEQRSKEISIRLVLGAPINSIFRLLTQNFVKLVTISFVIAAPLAWYLMQQWLEDYTNRTEIGMDIFIFAGIIALVIALMTISYQALRAALIKPIHALKVE